MHQFHTSISGFAYLPYTVFFTEGEEGYIFFMLSSVIFLLMGLLSIQFSNKYYSLNFYKILNGFQWSLRAVLPSFIISIVMAAYFFLYNSFILVSPCKNISIVHIALGCTQ